MKMDTKKQSLLSVLGGMGLLASAATSQAAVTVTWAQDGPDVTATWEGKLNFSPDPISSPPRVGPTIDLGTGLDLLHWRDGTTLLSGIGQSTETSLADVYDSPTLESNPSFGFLGGSISWSDVHVSIGTGDQVSELTFLGSRDVIRFSNQTLSGIGADNFNNTLAWTATARGEDTISYTTAAVPEPSVSLIAGLGILGLLARRKRA